jgi:hypothetical protein
MRTCTRCKIEKPDDQFYRKNAARLQSYCKNCFNDYCKERWHQRKLDAIEHMGGSCADCGYSDNPAVLQFHHLRDKDHEWTKLRLMSWDRVVEELSKCVMLCANCHVIRHSNY